MRLIFGISNKKNLYSLREIAPEVNYASDYIGWLLRNKKVKGKKVKTKPAWFIETKNFLEYCKKNEKLIYLDSKLLEKKYLSLKEASKISGYARDYIGYLARKGIIKGKKKYIGWKWLVKRESLKKYKEKEKNIFDFEKLSFFLKYATFILLLSFIFSGLYFLRTNKSWVKAQEEIKIVPSAVSGDWFHLKNVLTQETKENSSFENFSKENSAFLFELDQEKIKNLNCNQNSGKEEKGGFLKNLKKLFSFNLAKAQTKEEKNEGVKIKSLASTTSRVIEEPTSEEKITNEVATTITSTTQEATTIKEKEEPKNGEIRTEKEILIPQENEPSQKARTFEVSNFEIPPDFIEEKISNVQLRIALASRPLICENNAHLLIEYFFQGSWQKLTEIELDKEISNEINGGYLLFGLPVFENPEDLKNFKVRFTYFGKENEVQIFIDSVWLEMGYYSKSQEKDFEIMIPKKDWQANENPTFVILDKRKENILKRTFNKINKLFKGESELEVSTTLFDPEKKQHHLEKGKDFKTETHSPTAITIFKPENFRPGRYKVTIDFEKDGKSYHFEPEFTWGVLAINTNKSIYLPGEKAFFQMAVLDTLGHTVCDANLTLEITTPSGKKTIFTTEEIQIATTTEEIATSTIEEATTSKEITTTTEEITTTTEETIPIQETTTTEITTSTAENATPTEATSVQEQINIQETATSEEATTGNEILNQENQDQNTEPPNLENPNSQKENIENQPSSFLEKIKKFFGFSEVSAEELFYGKIEKSGECGPDNVTQLPDYFAFYDLSETGQYQIKLTAKTKEGTFEIYDSFEVRDFVPFEIERIGPTRIYPPADYQMKIKIKANEDYSGSLIEKVPESFEIVSCNGCERKGVKNGNFKEIIWQVNFEKGKEYEFSYQFDAPNIAPYLYLISPLEIESFKEARSWQIASDAPPLGYQSMMVYAKNGNTPYYRIWDPQTKSWSEERQANAVSGTIYHMVLKFARTRNEAILVTLDSTGQIRSQIWNGTSWSTTTLHSTITAGATYRAFDLEYETAGDRAILVFNYNESASPSYQIWNGISWSTRQSITVPTTGAPRWIKLARNPMATSSEIAMIYIDANVDIYGMVWTGSAWSNMGVSTVWDPTGSTATRESIAVAYEQSSGRAMFIWADAVATDNYYRIWNGSTLSSATLLDIPAMGGVGEWVRLVPRPNSNDLMYGVQDAAATPDLNTARWNGSSWTVDAEHDGGVEQRTSRTFDIVWETYPANSGVAWLIWGDDTTYSIKRWNGTAWETPTTAGDDTAIVKLMAHPQTGDVFALIFEDSSSEIGRAHV